VVPDEVVTYGREVAATLRAVLGDGLAGAWFVGSIALGGYVAGESDIDIVAIAEHAIADAMKPSIADAVFATTTSCPARGLEFALYRREVAETAPVAADFELNVNGGQRMARAIHLESRAEPRFWYVLDRAIAHRRGVVITGPPPAEMFAAVSRSTLLDALVESMRWHRQHERATLYSVLNASRAWRFAVEDVLGSKLEGAAWARQHWNRPWVIDAAVELRLGRPAPLDAAEVDALLDHVEHELLERRHEHIAGPSL
jgi:predicted nucleotidyltransferase